MERENGKADRKGSTPGGVVALMGPAVMLIVLVAFLVFVNEGRGPMTFGPQSASAESKSQGGEAKKAEEAKGGGHGEAKPEAVAEGKEGGGKEDVDRKLEAERRRREAAEARREIEGLEEKRLQIRKQEERLKAEQQKLKVLKMELSDKVSELEDMHRKIEESLKKIERKRSEKEVVSKEVQDKKIKQLVKMYSTMKPKQAGAIFNSMDIVIAEKILLNMKGDAAGKILAYVESPKAALISERLAISVGRTEGRP